MSFKTPFVLLFFCTVLHYGTGQSGGITCWVCNAKYAPGCGDPFEERGEMLKDCSRWLDTRNPASQPIGCKKIVNANRVNGEQVIHRDCAYDTDVFARNGPGCYVEGGGSGGDGATICICNTLNCNGASTLQTSYASVFVLFAILVMFNVRQ